MEGACQIAVELQSERALVPMKIFTTLALPVILDMVESMLSGIKLIQSLRLLTCELVAETPCQARLLNFQGVAGQDVARPGNVGENNGKHLLAYTTATTLVDLAA